MFFTFDVPAHFWLLVPTSFLSVVPALLTLAAVASTAPESRLANALSAKQPALTTAKILIVL